MTNTATIPPCSTYHLPGTHYFMLTARNENKRVLVPGISIVCTSRTYIYDGGAIMIPVGRTMHVCRTVEKLESPQPCDMIPPQLCRPNACFVRASRAVRACECHRRQSASFLKHFDHDGSSALLAPTVCLMCPGPHPPRYSYTHGDVLRQYPSSKYNTPSNSQPNRACAVEIGLLRLSLPGSRFSSKIGGDPVFFSAI